MQGKAVARPLDTTVEAPRGVTVVRALSPVALAPLYRVVVLVADRGGIPHRVGGMPALTVMGGTLTPPLSVTHAAARDMSLLIVTFMRLPCS